MEQELERFLKALEAFQHVVESTRDTHGVLTYEYAVLNDLRGAIHIDEGHLYELLERLADD